MPQLFIESLQCVQCSRDWENTRVGRDKFSAFKNVHSRGEQTISALGMGMGGKSGHPTYVWWIVVPPSPYMSTIRAKSCATLISSFPSRSCMGVDLDIMWSPPNPQRPQTGCGEWKLWCHACLGDSKSEEWSGSLSIPHTLDHQSGKPYLLFHSYYFPYYLFFLISLFTPRMAYRSLNPCATSRIHISEKIIGAAYSKSLTNHIISWIRSPLSAWSVLLTSPAWWTSRPSGALSTATSSKKPAFSEFPVQSQYLSSHCITNTSLLCHIHLPHARYHLGAISMYYSVGV